MQKSELKSDLLVTLSKTRLLLDEIEHSIKNEHLTDAEVAITNAVIQIAQIQTTLVKITNFDVISPRVNAFIDENFEEFKEVMKLRAKQLSELSEN